jgi:hypothetical protein
MNPTEKSDGTETWTDDEQVLAPATYGAEALPTENEDE